MSEVVPFDRPAPPAAPTGGETLEDRFGEDALWLCWCASWRAARAQMQKNWAEHDLVTGWGTLPDDHLKLDSAPLKRMDELQHQLSIAKPRTMLLARELLGMCATILAHRNVDPKSVLADGPVLEIVRNVISSLEWMKPDMRIGPKRGQRDDD